MKRILEYINGTDLKSRCARSSCILSVGTVADRGLAFISKMIVVRLLLPEEMGLMVLLLSLTAMFEVLTEVGIKQSVIHHKDGASDGYMNMAWWFQAIRAIGLYAIAFVIAPKICSFYFAGKTDVLALHSMDELIILVRVAFLVILFNGLISPAAYVLEKHFRFGKSMTILQGSAIIGTVVTIILAFIIRNVWALIFGYCCIALMKCMLSYIFCSFRPKFDFDKENFSELLKYAKGVFGSPILAYLALHLDVLVGGRLVGADVLGMYGMAVLLARIPVELFTYIINPVLLPAFAEQQNSPDELSDSILRLTRITSLITVPFVTVMVMFSREILSVVYGNSYVQIAPAFGLLCVYVLVQVKARILSNVFFGIGRPEMHRKFLFIRLFLIVILVYPAIKIYGMTGAAFVLVTANFIALMLQVFQLKKVLHIQFRDYTDCWLGGVKAGFAIMSFIVIFRVISPAMGIVSQVFRK